MHGLSVSSFAKLLEITFFITSPENRHIASIGEINQKFNEAAMIKLLESWHIPWETNERPNTKKTVHAAVLYTTFYYFDESQGGRCWIS